MKVFVARMVEVSVLQFDTLRLGVDWSDTLTSSSWKSVPATVTSTNGLYKFPDDGTLTAPLGPFRFYRIVLLP